MKLAVSSYSYQQYVNQGKMTQLDTVAKTAELGFDGIEFSGINPHDGSAPEAYAQKLAAECKKYNLPVVNFCVGNDFLKVPGGFDDAVANTKANVDIAAILGAPSMRHDATAGLPGKSFGAVLPQLAEGCRQVAEYAQSKGIVTMVENHGFFSQDSTRVEALCTAVDHPNFGLLVDMGNFLCADEDPVTAVGRVASLARHAHAKDFIVKCGNGPSPGEGFFNSRSGAWLRGTIVGHGQVPVLHCIRALKRAGYDGYLSIEFEGIEDAVDGIRIGLANLRNYVQMA